MNNKTCLLTSIVLSAVLVMAVVPGGISPQVDAKFFGAAEMILYDIEGIEKFRQTVHNQIVDDGEDYMLSATFADGDTFTDATSIGSICVSAQATASVDTLFGTAATVEALDAATFDGTDGLTLNNCKEGTTTVTASDGDMSLGALTFLAGTSDNVPADTTITTIAICQTGTGSDFANCVTNGILFATVNTSDVTLADGESVDITYTFDISSDTT